MWNRSLWEQEHQAELKEIFYNQADYGGKYVFKEPIRRIVCDGCGKTFTPKRTDAVYCSNACRQRAYRRSVADKTKSSSRRYGYW